MEHDAGVWQLRSGRMMLLPVLGFLALVVGLAFLVFRFFILDFVVAASISLLVFPLQRRLASLFGGRGSLAAAVLVILVTLVIFVPVLSSLLVLGNQARNFLSWLGPRLQPAQLQIQLQEWIERYPLVAAWLEAQRPTGVPVLADALQRLAAGANTLIQGTIARFTAALFDIFLFLLMLFFLLRDGAALRSEFHRVSPFSPDQEAEIFDHISKTVKGVLQAMVLVPIVQGIVAGLGFWFFGLPSPLAWGVGVVFAAFVPILGSPLGWVPAAVYLFYTGPPRSAIFLALYGLVVISGIDNVVKPLILHGAAQIHPLLGFLSILGGVFAFGPLGFLVGPVVLSLGLSAVRIYRDDVLAMRPRQGLTPPPAET
jgi:predicted PurR-regulated permease PerM